MRFPHLKTERDKIITRIISFGGKILIFNRDYWKKEWTALEKREAKFLAKQWNEKPSGIQEKLSDKVPEKLEDTLKTAFTKAFGLVFVKGTGVIEKTYNKEKISDNYKINEFAANLKSNRKNVKAFSKKANTSRNVNLLVSAVEGIGFGVLGVGIPDIPVFTAVILKSIYEIALSYGFEYESKEEQIFILKLIETALLKGEEFETNNIKMNEEIDFQMKADVSEEQVQERIEKTAVSLSEALLYMKFLQGIPIVGVAGGLADTVYLKKITDYADLKYKRRFLKDKGKCV